MTTTTPAAADIALPTDFLRAALVCASTEKSRYYLNGVYLDPTGWIVATDGHRLFAARCPAVRALPEGLILPRDTVKAALAKSRRIDATLVALGGGCYTLDAGPKTVLFTPIDGHFPDWRRVVPTEASIGGPAHFDPDYYCDLGVMAKALECGKTGFYVKQYPLDACPVTFGTRRDCFAVIMPFRVDPTAFDSAMWLVDE